MEKVLRVGSVEKLVDCCDASFQPLLPLLVPIVTRRAERLPVGSIPKQGVVATMGDDVINGGCGCATAGPCTAIIDLEKGVTGFAPCVVVAACRCRRAASVMAFVPGACRCNLTDTTRAVGHDLTAGADMGRARHQSAPMPFRARNPARSNSGSRPASMFACF